MLNLSNEWKILAAVALIALIAYGFRKSAGSAFDREAKKTPPKGWLSDDVTLEDALDVADRHLIAARSAANVRLQYGLHGCLTLIRRVNRKRETRYLLRWEFWEPDTALADALQATPEVRIEAPKPEVLELWFDGDYVRFKRTVQDLFGGMDTVPGNTHLTWVC